jgi:hypothetical protein
MNDELSAQLAAKGWRVPDYAASALWIEADGQAVRTEGPTGLFTLNAPAAWVNVRWGHAAGALLARLRWQADNLNWNGRIRVGGYVDGLHLSQLGTGGDEYFGVIAFGGQPLKPDTILYPGMTLRTHDVYVPPDFYKLIDSDVPESTTTWIASDEGPLLTMAQDAMFNKTRVVFTGRLTTGADHWERLLALPLILETITLFAP